MFLRSSHIRRKTAVRASALAILVVLAWLPATSQALDIAEGWRFHTGDDATWARPEFDDSAWEAIKVGTPWEKAGHKDYDGYGWYRLRVTVPKTESEDAYFEQYQRLTLLLGAVDDVDVTYFNGVEVGRTGAVPDDTAGHRETPRIYRVPGALVRWDAENVIAVRVFDDSGDGGMYSGPQTLVPPAWQDFVAVDISRGRGNGIYPDGAPMNLSATIDNSSFETIGGTVQWKVESDTWILENRGKPFADVTRTVSIAPGTKHATDLAFDPPAAAFYQVTCTFTRKRDDSPVSQSRMRGYAPEKMKRPPTPPADLRKFWDETIAALAEVAPQYKVTPAPESNTEQTDCFLVEMRSLGDKRIRGWLEVPKAPGPHPALIRVPGYTQGMMPTKSIPDMVVLSLNIRGHGNSMDDEPGYFWWGPGDYLLRGLHDRYRFFYRGAFADSLRGLDFVASRPEVDVKRIAITGGSQGGMLSFATAALDKRIALSAPDIPFVIDSMKGFEMTAWPGWIIRDWLKRDPANTWALASETLSYIDPKNLAGWVECPVFMGAGLQDSAAPVPTAFAAYNQVRGPKAYRVYPEAGHSTPPEHDVAKMTWIRKRFGMAATWRAQGHGLNVDEYAPGDQAITLKTCTQLAFENGYEIITDLGNNRFLYRRGEGDLWQVSPIPVNMQHSLLFNPTDKLYYANDTANQRMIAFRNLGEASVHAEATEMGGVKLHRPHDVVRDPATGWLYMINPNEPVVVRFRALGVDETALSLDKELNYSRGLTFAKGRLYVIGSSVGKVIEITDFDKGAFRVHTGHGKKAEGPAGNWLRTGLVPNDVEWFNGWWYLTSFFTPAAPYSKPGDDFDTHKFIRFRDWAAFESGDWEDLSDLIPSRTIPYYLTAHDKALYLAIFSDAKGGNAILHIRPSRDSVVQDRSR